VINIQHQQTIFAMTILQHMMSESVSLSMVVQRRLIEVVSKNEYWISAVLDPHNRRQWLALRPLKAMAGEKPRTKGKVKWFNAGKGYGFITPDPDSNLGVDELLAHQTAIQMDGFRTLDEGAPVTFVVEQGSNGLQATDIRPDTNT
ncbi:hypothetical protein BGZ83_002528, partial [Gryganskiella cystojenkinii]